MNRAAEIAPLPTLPPPAAAASAEAYAIGVFEAAIRAFGEDAARRLNVCVKLGLTAGESAER